jgi:hypothetical protein
MLCVWNCGWYTECRTSSVIVLVHFRFCLIVVGCTARWTFIVRSPWNPVKDNHTQSYPHTKTATHKDIHTQRQPRKWHPHTKQPHTRTATQKGIHTQRHPQAETSTQKDIYKQRHPHTHTHTQRHPHTKTATHKADRRLQISRKWVQRDSWWVERRVAGEVVDGFSD